jgi:group I intron endonuclease
MKISGIYKIQSIIKPEKCYIGSAVQIQTRWYHHLSRLRLNKHHSQKLQHHYNKYGESDLIFSILLGCEKEYLIANEQFFIDSHKPWFNIDPIAGSRLGSKATEETCQKLSKRMKGKKMHLGFKHSEETRLRMSKPRSEEGRKNMSEAQKKFFKTDEGLRMIAKQKEDRRGLKASELTKNKMSESGYKAWAKRKLIS